MKLLLPLFIACFILASSGAEKVYLNNEVDSVLERIRKLKTSKRFLNVTTGEVAEMGPGVVTIGDGTLLGLDSLTRTGDCFKFVDYSNKAFHFQIGLKLLIVDIPRMTFNGVPMAATFRIDENSLTLNYTVNEENCLVTVDLLQVEQFQNVHLISSVPDFDGSDFDQMFQNGVRKWINKGLDKIRPELEDRLRFRCLIPIIKEEIPPIDIVEAFASLIEEIAMF